MIKDDLEKLGFTSEESDCYMALLETGGGFASTIARKAHSHRVTTYNTLENLEKKGFARKAKKRGILFFYPVNPQFLLNRIEERFETAKSVVPELIDLQSAHTFKPKIQFFEGKDDIWEVFKDMLESKTEVIGYTNFEMAQDLFADYLTKYQKEVLEKGLKHRLLCPNDEFHRTFIKERLGDRIEADILEIFAVNPQQFAFKNAQYIYDDKVVTVSFDKDELMGGIYESPANAETNRAIFDLAWLGATSFVAK
ncbi:hypothetical protein HN709_04270 [Candidatus Peregrinibacteria bacterium]|jgi:HTH-type transcriptional regulator, sugar sensing transcriptional regulator|nr:hypothetical protein [Candidatus Peregrinibacteria bacterium]MBT7736879.1 hypothetical protein [Candidatus Peregrinibacteria bacterium]